MLACGEENEGDVGKCVEVWGPNTLLIPHISSLPSPFPTSPLTSPTPHHTFLHLLSYVLPHLPPHPNTFSCYPHISLHLLKVWRSFCGEVTVAKLPCGEVTGDRLKLRRYIHSYKLGLLWQFLVLRGIHQFACICCRCLLIQVKYIQLTF